MISDIDALHDILLNCIIPLLYKNKTNLTILIFRSVSKTCRKRLCDLVYATFNLDDQTQANDLVSCDLVDGIVFPGYDQRMVDLEWNIVGIPILKLRPYAGNWVDCSEDVLLDMLSESSHWKGDKLRYKLMRTWRDGGIYDRYCASLPLILDQSLTFEHRLELVETYIHHLSDFFNDKYTSMTFYTALIGVGLVSKSISKRLEPYIDSIIDSWLDSISDNVTVLISIGRHLDLFDLVFDKLQEHVSNVKHYSKRLVRLLITCLELGNQQTLEYLGVDICLLSSNDPMFSCIRDLSPTPGRTIRPRSIVYESKEHTHFGKGISITRSRSDIINVINMLRGTS